MRNFFILFSLILISCGTSKQVSTSKINEDGDLVGYSQKIDFETAPFNEWFSENYNDYTLDITVVNEIKPLLKEVKIKAVIGTWCGDSRREIPVFYKLLDAAGFDYKNLTMITVDRSKNLPVEEQLGLDIERVPTFIFYKNKMEFNRFVEYPRETFEIDFLNILQEVGYKHSYLD